MQNTSPKPTNHQEIDLSYLYQSLLNFIDSIGFSIYRMVRFLLRNWMITISVLILGFGLGYYLYKSDPKAFKQEVIVVPNFHSTSYLYEKVNNFNKKHKDPASKLSHISSIEVAPIVDVFQFVSDSKQNLEIAKYMSENTIEVAKYKKNNDIEKLYKYHKITYYTDVEDTDQKIFDALLQDLNSDSYLQERQKVETVQTQNKLQEHIASVENINNVFKKLGNVSENSKDLNVEMYSQINDLMLTKKDLLNEITKVKIEVIEQSKIIYDASKSLNTQNKNIFKVILIPFVFIVLFLCSAYVWRQAKRYQKRANTL